jgi:hypothetical protein
LKALQIYRLLFCLFLLAGIVASCNKKPRGRKIPPMNPTYAYKDKDPLGTFMAYRLLPGQFDGEVVLASKKLKAFNPLTYVTNTAYVIISRKIYLSAEECNMALQYADRGNELFMSSYEMDYHLLDTLGIQIGEEGIDTSSIKSYAFGGDKTDTYISVLDSDSAVQKKYGFYYYPFDRIITKFDSSSTKVLGVNEKGNANFIVVRYGKGKIYFHTEPAAFSNYFLLTKDNTDYYKKIFAYMSPRANTVYWGDVIKFGDKKDDFSALSIFWKNKSSLLPALLIACGLMLLYIAFGSKRKRRLVPTIAPNTNATVSFVHTISNLYLQKKDNRNIALKMISYFFEYVRTHFYLNTNQINAEFIQALSRKSGIDEKKVTQLVDKINQVNEAEIVIDIELFDLNNRIQEFYKR